MRRFGCAVLLTPLFFCSGCWLASAILGGPPTAENPEGTPPAPWVDLLTGAVAGLVPGGLVLERAVAGARRRRQHIYALVAGVEQYQTKYLNGNADGKAKLHEALKLGAAHLKDFQALADEIRAIKDDLRRSG